MEGRTEGQALLKKTLIFLCVDRQRTLFDYGLSEKFSDMSKMAVSPTSAGNPGERSPNDVAFKDSGVCEVLGSGGFSPVPRVFNRVVFLKLSGVLKP